MSTDEKNDRLDQQRLNLEQMSQELTQKLDIMIEQQNKRVQAFISIEGTSLEDISPYAQAEASPYVQQVTTASATPTSSYVTPLPAAPTQVAPPQPTTHSTTHPKPKRTPTRATKNKYIPTQPEEAQESESSIGLPQIIGIILFAFFFIRGCAD